MKKLLLLLSVFALFSCEPKKVDEVVSYEYNGSWYWVVQYKPEASKKDIEEFVNTWANPEQTSHFFVFDNSVDLSVFKASSFSFNQFAQTILVNKPKYGYYKMMPADNTLHDNAIWLLEQSQKR